MTKTRTLVPLALAVAFATNASAACLSDAQAAELAAHYLSRQPAANPEGLSDADGACTRAKLNALLAPRLGKVVGYKAGLTNPAVQKRFNTDKPVWGKLYEGMVLANGATVEAAFGARPLYEADMLVRVKSAAINQARTPMEVLEAIDQVIPFIELPDLVVQDPTKITGPTIALINVGARLGVLGAPIPARTDAAFADALRDMTVRMTDLTGREINAPKGSAILGHPLNAVVWLAAELKRQGKALKPGDMLSLGAFASAPVVAGNGVRVSYEGLASNATVSVRFR